MEARKKADNSALRRIDHVERLKFAHTCQKLNRWDVQIWIRNFTTSVVNMLSRFLHIQEALQHSIKSEESSFSFSIIDRKLVSAKAMISAVFKRACESDRFMMKKTFGEGNTWCISYSNY